MIIIYTLCAIIAVVCVVNWSKIIIKEGELTFLVLFMLLVLSIAWYVVDRVLK